MADQNNAPATAPATTEAPAGNESVLNGEVPAAAAPAADAQGEPAAAAPAAVDAKGEPAATDATAEIAYTDFTMPEGMEIDKAALEQALPVFKELGLKQDQAQKLIDLQVQMVKANHDAYQAQVAEWQKQARTDKEFGGDKFDESVKTANFAVKKFGNDAFVKMLADYGVGNHPEMIRFMVNLGKTLKEDVPGSTGAHQAQGNKSYIDILYPNQ